MTTLIAAGCSATTGDELSDCNVNNYNSQLSWAALTAKEMAWDYRCVAISGLSNRGIQRTCSLEINKSKGEDIFVVVMWTNPYRLETKLRNSTKHNHSTLKPPSSELGRKTLSFWAGLSVEEQIDRWDDLTAGEKKALSDQHDENVKSGLYEVSRVLSNNLHDDYYYEESLTSQLLLLNQLKDNNIPYIFLTACDAIKPNNIPTSNEYISYLKENVMKANWIQNQKYGFMEWARKNKYELAEKFKHPLEQAHKDFAYQFVIPAIKPKMNDAA
jgi:hypothetical protein